MCAVAVVKSSKHFEIKHSSRVKLGYIGDGQTLNLLGSEGSESP